MGSISVNYNVIKASVNLYKLQFNYTAIFNKIIFLSMHLLQCMIAMLDFICSLSRQEREGNEKFKMKILFSIGIRNHT